MKKERSAFFQNQSSSYYYPENYMPNFYNQMSNQIPFESKSNSSFYQGPIQTNNNNINDSLNKLKEDILNLDKRITKLETELNTNNPNNNMYMI